MKAVYIEKGYNRPRVPKLAGFLNNSNSSKLVTSTTRLQEIIFNFLDKNFETFTS